MLILPAAVSMLALLIAPPTGTAAITFRVDGRVVEATLRAPRAAFAQWPRGAPAALVAGSCSVRADMLPLQPVNETPKTIVNDTMVTAVVRYRAALAPQLLDVSCALFPSKTAVAPHPSLVVVLAGSSGRTAVIAANADGRVDAGMRVGR